MNSDLLDQLVKKTLTNTDRDVGNIPCQEIQQKLLPVNSSNNLELLPIWDYPTDDPEGPTYREYIQKNPWYNSIYVRESLALKINQVTNSIPNDWLLIVRAGHRPFDVQKGLLDQVADNYMLENPEATVNQALTHARTYYSDPEQKLPPHTCGAAIDVDARNRTTNELIDFGCAVNTQESISFWVTKELTDLQSKNRITLLRAMLAAGFAPHPNEWWHFSYGDQYWADFYEQSASLFGLIEANKNS